MQDARILPAGRHASSQLVGGACFVARRNPRPTPRTGELVWRPSLSSLSPPSQSSQSERVPRAKPRGRGRGSDRRGALRKCLPGCLADRPRWPRITGAYSSPVLARIEMVAGVQHRGDRGDRRREVGRQVQISTPVRTGASRAMAVRALHSAKPPSTHVPEGRSRSSTSHVVSLAPVTS
ncbi:unnamed protein product [Diplocarpon coronariae]